MVHLKQQDKYIMKLLLLILIFTFFSCGKKGKESIEVKTSKQVEIESSIERKTNKNNSDCFQSKDSVKISSLLLKFSKEYLKKDMSEYLSENYIETFEKFPNELFEQALKNDAKPIFEIKEDDVDCNLLPVYYNYMVKIIDDGEEYSSESTLIFYFIKTKEGEILLEGMGAAG